MENYRHFIGMRGIFGELEEYRSDEAVLKKVDIILPYLKEIMDKENKLVKCMYEVNHSWLIFFERDVEKVADCMGEDAKEYYGLNIVPVLKGIDTLNLIIENLEKIKENIQKGLKTKETDFRTLIDWEEAFGEEINLLLHIEEDYIKDGEVLIYFGE